MMSEQEIKEKIKYSAENIEIPEGLQPEKMKEKFSEDWKLRRKQKIKYRKIGSVAAAAACLMFVYVSSIFLSAGGDASIGVANDAASNAGSPAYDILEEGVLEENADSGMNMPESEKNEKAKKLDAGDLYIVAKDYGEVYDMLYENTGRFYKESASDFGIFVDVKESAEDGAEPAEGAAANEMSGSGETIVQEEEEQQIAYDSMQNAAADMNASAKKEYSKTNLQTAGVDESDIIKTDGSYIYTVTNHEILITDVRTDTMKNAGRIAVPMNSAIDSIREMYVDGDTLNLILEKESTELNRNEKIESEDTEEEEMEAVYDMDVYYLDSMIVTELLTYDISDRKNPVLKGSVTQEGSYKTSRKIGNIVYLFTDEGMSVPSLERSDAILKDHTSGWIPIVNGEAIAADCIYIPQEQGRLGLIISSVNVDEPDKVIDNTMILNNYVEIYVGSSSIYLYDVEYSSDSPNTQIAKFSMKNGEINAVGAASVRGEIYDTFAINENAGKLRVLTTDWSQGDNENQLYLLDENMNLTGKLEHIATGEQIYAARFFGNTAYFVTYRNTDPLFAVDLSDEENPKILSELKITGFSEYLHFWGNDKLLGIGYETDEDTGERLGIKLTMFDISNPTDLQTVGTCVIENADYSPALYNYKCVLVDEKENLIGFTTETYGKKEICNYLLFSWENGKFTEKMTESLDSENVMQLEKYRGIYIGDIFYVVNPIKICSYDRKNEYRLIQKFVLSDREEN